MEKRPDTSDKYIEALLDGRITFLTNLARQRGRKSDEYIFHWSGDGLEICVDDTKFLLTVTFVGKVVCSNEAMIFVAGDWWKIVEKYTEQTIKNVQAAEAQRGVEIMLANNPN
jgi:hypothetical protein